MDLYSAPAMGKKLATEGVMLETFGDSPAVNVGVGDTGIIHTAQDIQRA